MTDNESMQFLLAQRAEDDSERVRAKAAVAEALAKELGSALKAAEARATTAEARVAELEAVMRWGLDRIGELQAAVAERDADLAQWESAFEALEPSNDFEEPTEARA